MIKICHGCTNAFLANDRGGRPTDLCPDCRKARDNRRDHDKQELNAESLRIKNQGIGRRRQEGRPFGT